MLTNFCLDEYCNIGYLDGVADSLNSIRGFNMSAQIVVQSLSQWQEKYPGKEWENQLATFDQTLYMGCNDLTSAKYKMCIRDRYMPATWLTDTVRQLLTAYMQHTNFRLHFKQMLLVIDEHSDVDRCV